MASLTTRLDAAWFDPRGSGVALLAQVADSRFGADGITAALAFVQVGDPDPGTLAGALRLPSRASSASSTYGTRVDPLTGALGYHPGIDFAAPAGTPVHATAAGTVVAGDCGGYGNCVVVGLVGSTGRSTGPHLHFEVRVHGIPVDPIQALTS